jgi:hypothetical protein
MHRLLMGVKIKPDEEPTAHSSGSPFQSIPNTQRDNTEFAAASETTSAAKHNISSKKKTHGVTLPYRTTE